MLERLLLGVFVTVIALSGSYLFGAGVGKADERVVWELREAKLMKEQLDLREDHAKEKDRLILSHQRINKENSDDHEVAIEKLHSDLSAARTESRRLGGLRIPAPVCPVRETGTDAQTTGTGQRDEEATATIALPEAIEDGLWSIVGQADEVTEQLRACQGWIIDNGFYGEPVK